MLSSSELAVIVLIISLTSLTFWKDNSKEDRKLPPGPFKIPFFGNLFHFLPLRPHPQWLIWAQKYGPIFHLQLGPQSVVVLNTAEAADELLVNRSRIYSSRSSPHVAHDIMSAGQRMVFLPYEKEYKTVRKSLQSSLGPMPSKQLRPTQDLESRVLLYDLSTNTNGPNQEASNANHDNKVPEAHWFSLIRRYTTSVVITLAYGKRIHQIRNNPRLHKIYDVMENVVAVGQPGNYLADAFPIIRLLPDFLAPWRIEGRTMHDWEMELWGGFLNDLKADIQGSSQSNSYVGSYLKQRAESGHEQAPGLGITEDGWLRDTLLAYTAGTVLEAGSDTTSSTLQSFILFMLNHPTVLKKLREEIDNVVGSDRMPDFDDEPRLPYLIACIKETLRCRPPAPLAVPHAVSEDDTWNGYFIPKNTVVFGNVWAIHMDPNRYPNPTVFNPDRFLTKDGSIRWGGGSVAHERDHYVFGWGRRFCPGSHIAEANLFIVLSRIIWGTEFRAPLDLEGYPSIPDAAEEESFTDGFSSGPRLFNVSFHPRSKKRAEIIRASFEEAQAEFKDSGLAIDERST